MADQYEGRLSDPTWEVGSVNVDSLKEILLALAAGYPFLSETDKTNFEAQIHGLETSGDPHKTVEEVKVDEKDAEIAALQAQIAELQAKSAGGGQ